MVLKTQDLYRLWDNHLPELLQNFQGVMVGCSAGLDSTVLFHLLYDYAKNKKNFSLAICHVNFGLRAKENWQEEEFLQSLAERHQVPIFVHRAHEKPKKNIQAWARDLRLSIFSGYQKQGWLIALGHHEDDLAENAIMRLCRGSSPGHFGGMSFYHQGILKPLLYSSKQDLAEFAARHKIQHLDDSSNGTLIYKRNVMRHKVLVALEDLYPGAKQRISRCAGQARDLMLFAEQIIKKELDSQNNKLSINSLKSYPESVALLALSTLIGPRKCQHKELSYSFLSECLNQLFTCKQDVLTIKIPASEASLVLRNGLISLASSPLAKTPVRQHENALTHRKFAAILQDKDYFETYGFCGQQKELDLFLAKDRAGKLLLSSRRSKGRTLWAHEEEFSGNLTKPAQMLCLNHFKNEKPQYSPNPLGLSTPMNKSFNQERSWHRPL